MFRNMMERERISENKIEMKNPVACEEQITGFFNGIILNN